MTSSFGSCDACTIRRESLAAGRGFFRGIDPFIAPEEKAAPEKFDGAVGLAQPIGVADVPGG